MPGAGPARRGASGSAHRSLDGAAPDRTAASERLGVCLARIDSLLALELGSFRGAAKDAAAARKKAAPLVAKVQGTTKIDALLKSYKSVLAPLARAADAID